MIEIDGSVIWLVIIAIVIIIFAFRDIADKRKKDKLTFENKQADFEKREAEYKLRINEFAHEQFEKFKTEELEAYRKIIRESAYEDAQVTLRGWVMNEEKGLRRDAITRSMGVNYGKITEHLLPFSEHLKDFDPRDIRFIGSPVDLLIFDGATAKKDVIHIYLVEVKTAGSKLTKKQKSIQDAVDNAEKRIHFFPIHVPEFKWDLADEE